jgi:hypothetical protein
MSEIASGWGWSEHEFIDASPPSAYIAAHHYGLSPPERTVAMHIRHRWLRPLATFITLVVLTLGVVDIALAARVFHCASGDVSA